MVKKNCTARKENKNQPGGKNFVATSWQKEKNLKKTNLEMKRRRVEEVDDLRHSPRGL